MKMKNITKWLAASVVFGLLSLATERADAVLEMSYTTDSPNLLGTVVPGQLSPPGQAARDAAMTNYLLGMGLQTQIADPNGSLYSRTTLAAGPAATIVGAVALTGYSGGTGNVTIDLSNNGYGTFRYLVATYDGPNGGVAVFDISGITTSVTVYGFAKPERDGSGNLTGNLLGASVATQGYFRLTTITLFNPGGFVPDGGATVMLLGAALGALGVVRRYLFS